MSKLFRPEAVEARRVSAFGRVTIHQPIAFGVITTTILIIVVAAIAFSASVSFAKKESAAGWIVPQGGMSQVFAPQGALIRSVVVRPGERVRRGQILAVLSTDTSNTDGETGEQERAQIAAQNEYINAQIAASRSRMAVSSRHARDQVAALLAEADMLDGERQLQVGQLKVVQQQLQDIEPLVKKGFISKFDADRRRQEALSIRQAISSIDRQIRDREAQAEAARSDAADASSRQAAEEAQLRASQSSLRVSRIAVDNKVGATLRAPIDGTIAAINDQAGETAQAALPVISVAPFGPVEAELLLPTRAAGLIQRGQAVRLFIDAFPYQRYGAMIGVISEIGRAAVVPNEYAAPIRFTDASYRVRVRITRGLMNVPGETPKVQVGMTLTGSIVADKRTVLQWLLDPLRAH